MGQRVYRDTELGRRVEHEDSLARLAEIVISEASHVVGFHRSLDTMSPTDIDITLSKLSSRLGRLRIRSRRMTAIELAVEIHECAIQQNTLLHLWT